MNFLSLFSGVEAASVAWESLGFKCLGLSEIAPFPSAVLEHRYPQVKNLGDITLLTKEKLYETINEPIQIIIGGSPCQAFSLAGDRKGFEDERGRLMFDFIRIVGEVKPLYVVWENVRGVLSSNGGKDFGTLLGCLVEFGYDLEWRILDTQDFGLPQSRSRVYLVGHLRGTSSELVLSHREGSGGVETPSSKKRGESTRTSTGSTKVTKTKTIANGRDIVGCLCARDYKGIGSDCVAMGKVIVETSEEDIRLRRLSPREYERLQGFPDDWTKVPWNGKPADSCPDGHRYKAMGNTMSVPVVRWIGKQILKHYKGGE